MLQDPIGPDTGQIRCMAQPSGWPPLLPTGRRHRQSSCGPGPLISVGVEKRQMQTNEDTKRRMDWVILARGYVCKGVMWKMASRNTSMWGLFVQMLYMVRRGGEKERAEHPPLRPEPTSPRRRRTHRRRGPSPSLRLFDHIAVAVLPARPRYVAAPTRHCVSTHRPRAHR